MHPGQTTGSETHAAFGRRSIPAEPRRFAPLIVAFRSEYTRYSSLTRLVNRAPRRPRRSRGFHHRLFTTPLRGALRCVSVEIHSGQFSRWGLLPHAPCQPGASPLSALTRVPPPAVKRRRYFPVRQRPEVRLDGRHSRQRALDSFPGHVLLDVTMRPTPSQDGTLSLLEAVSGRTIRDCEVGGAQRHQPWFRAPARCRPEVGVPLPPRHKRVRPPAPKTMAANSVRCPRDRGESVKGGATAPLSQSNSSNRESRRDLRFPARSAGGSRRGACALNSSTAQRQDVRASPFGTPWPSGGGGIRTHGTVAGTPAFRAGQFSHSCTPPGSGGTWNATPLRLGWTRRLRFGQPESRTSQSGW